MNCRKSRARARMGSCACASRNTSLGHFFVWLTFSLFVCNAASVRTMHIVVVFAVYVSICITYLPHHGDDLEFGIRWDSSQVKRTSTLPPPQPGAKRHTRDGIPLELLFISISTRNTRHVQSLLLWERGRERASADESREVSLMMPRLPSSSFSPPFISFLKVYAVGDLGHFGLGGYVTATCLIG